MAESNQEIDYEKIEKVENGKHSVDCQKSTVEPAQKEPEKAVKKIEPLKLESTPMKVWMNEKGEVDGVIDPTLKDPVIRKIAGTKDTEIAENVFYSSTLAIDGVIRGSQPERLHQSMNIIAQSLNDYQPKDLIESRLVSQAAVLYQHGMDQIARAGNAKFLNQSDSCYNAGVKLLRLHNETVQALTKYRSGGEQRVLVQHVNVGEGGQAVVAGNWQQGGGVNKQTKGGSSCSKNAELRPEQMKISHVEAQQWQTDGAGFTAEKVQAPKQKRVRGR